MWHNTLGAILSWIWVVPSFVLWRSSHSKMVVRFLYSLIDLSTGFNFRYIHFADFSRAVKPVSYIGVDFHMSRKHCISPSTSDTHWQRRSPPCNFLSSPQCCSSHYLFSLYHCDFFPLYYLPQHTIQVKTEQCFCAAASAEPG